MSDFAAKMKKNPTINSVCSFSLQSYLRLEMKVIITEGFIR